MAFTRPITDRYLDDYVEGDVHQFGSIAVEADEVIAFANRFDPQAMHADPEAAKKGPFGGLIASGWHTASLTMRLYVEHYLTHAASLASPGLDELRWLKPVRPGDTLHTELEVVEKTPSRSKPDRGILRMKVQIKNQKGEDVTTFTTMHLARRKP